ncbi:voltage-dependent calcium channel gamma-1 subunit [Protopterus annectens]|uniref:voltage-dependent calcium channel gamma-1 subunit n=1 Tax=Protopterus annectens TaxID=7888 RepID=UPI001CFB5DA7|nr:voltage-dependent calcium channel gamma-1 subunit [Protopterus annectens]
MEKSGKVKITFSIILIGCILLLVAVVTDHWAVLSPQVKDNNITCDVAHFGLWRLCIKRLYIGAQSTHSNECGPLSLPGEYNCTYFKHFTPGLEEEIFEITTQKEYSISAAAIAIFAIGFVILATICNLLSFRQKLDYLLKPASMFYTFGGLCTFVTVEIMRQSVTRMIKSDATVWIAYYYSWSFGCACAAAILLVIFGIILLLVSLPRMPQNPWESCMDAEPEH